MELKIIIYMSNFKVQFNYSSIHLKEQDEEENIEGRQDGDREE